MKIKIDEPHGYLLDSDGRVVDRFGGWKVGVHEVTDAVKTVEYVDGPAAHSKEIHPDYRSDP